MSSFYDELLLRLRLRKKDDEKERSRKQHDEKELSNARLALAGIGPRRPEQKHPNSCPLLVHPYSDPIEGPHAIANSTSWSKLHKDLQQVERYYVVRDEDEPYYVENFFYNNQDSSSPWSIRLARDHRNRIYKMGGAKTEHMPTSAAALAGQTRDWIKEADKKKKNHKRSGASARFNSFYSDEDEAEIEAVHAKTRQWQLFFRRHLSPFASALFSDGMTATMNEVEQYARKQLHQVSNINNQRNGTGSETSSRCLVDEQSNLKTSGTGAGQMKAIVEKGQDYTKSESEESCLPPLLCLQELTKGCEKLRLRKRALAAPNAAQRATLQWVFDQIEGDTGSRFLWSRRSPPVQAQHQTLMELVAFLKPIFLHVAEEWSIGGDEKKKNGQGTVLASLFSWEKDRIQKISKPREPLPVPTRLTPEAWTLGRLVDFFREQVRGMLLMAFDAKLYPLAMPPDLLCRRFQEKRDNRRALFLAMSGEEQVEAMFQFARLLKGHSTAGHPVETGDTSWMLQRGESCLGLAHEPAWYPRSSHYLKMLYELFFGNGGAGRKHFPLGFMLYDCNSFVRSANGKMSLPKVSAIGYVLKQILEVALQKQDSLLVELRSPGSDTDPLWDYQPSDGEFRYPRKVGSNVVYTKDILRYRRQLSHFLLRFRGLQKDLAHLAEQSCSQSSAGNRPFSGYRESTRDLIAQDDMLRVYGDRYGDVLFAVMMHVHVWCDVVVKSDVGDLHAPPFGMEHFHGFLPKLENQRPEPMRISAHRDQYDLAEPVDGASGSADHRVSTTPNKNCGTTMPSMLGQPLLQHPQHHRSLASFSTEKSAQGWAQGCDAGALTLAAPGSFPPVVNYPSDDADLHTTSEEASAPQEHTESQNRPMPYNPYIFSQLPESDNQLTLRHLRAVLEDTWPDQDFSQQHFFTESGNHFHVDDRETDFSRSGSLDWVATMPAPSAVPSQTGAVDVGQPSWGLDLPLRCSLEKILHQHNVTNAADMGWFLFARSSLDIVRAGRRMRALDA
ncbi:unnamed protein product [Amoebophrya sp. A25]|nr:unnamed protein product [Amoebophrya sp. A25]|eukprot:GSA25T00018649001.1